ncbi:MULTISPECIES: DUF2628 domain-containing protein [Mesorhizobium]|uniref:DUF2628 domain-containing protein n=1 Tax=Mesorhizobium denitrificans TaxID=2294114 RepID=A0A371XHI8_9HYPH|nr:MULTISPECIES: DUF2628 domain-containing protein [Mesorhizobium]RFC68504.1 DUF2628 domain-containing protein [Mesorhizobium denitrificans]
MASFVIVEPPAGSKAETVIVKDGFAVLGFLVPPLWLAWHRLWLEAITVALLLVVLDWLARGGGYGVFAAMVSFAVSVLVGLEGARLRVAALERKGWHQASYIDARNEEEAEARFAFARFGVAA